MFHNKYHVKKDVIRTLDEVRWSKKYDFEILSDLDKENFSSDYEGCVS